MVISVSDSEILEAKRATDVNGVGCEPASAASLAGLRSLVQRGTIASDASVVAVLTGHLLKDPLPPSAGSYTEKRKPLQVDATLAAIESVLRTNRHHS
jgi:threonine synthase